MSTSERAFNQVKAILGKLDRSIDQARQKRLQTIPPLPSRQAGQASPIGRAQPLRSPADKDRPTGASAFQRWAR